jgi:hypothetical protein
LHFIFIEGEVEAHAARRVAGRVDDHVLAVAQAIRAVNAVQRVVGLFVLLPALLGQQEDAAATGFERAQQALALDGAAETQRVDDSGR